MQVLDVKGDWAARRPDVRPGGWAFQYANAALSRLDDTAVVVMAMDRARAESGGAHFDAGDRARRMDRRPAEPRTAAGPRSTPTTTYHLSQQHPVRRSRRAARSADRGRDRALRVDAGAARRHGGRRLADGGAGDRLSARDPDRRRHLVRPLGHSTTSTAPGRCCARSTPRACAQTAPEVRKAAAWLIAIQNADGGWGEDGSSYKLDYKGYERGAEHGLADRLGVARPDGGGRGGPSGGRARHRISRPPQSADGFWDEERYTATGFPRVFYLRYHGYRNSSRSGRWRAIAI